MQVRTWLVALFVTFGAILINAQDIHFSQFWNQSTVYNISNIIDEEDISFSITARDQWISIPVPYRTQKLEYAQKINPKHKSNWIAVGMALINDKAGEAQYSNQSLGVNLSSHIHLYDQIYMRIGASINYVNRYLDDSLVKLGHQFDGDQFRQGINPFDQALEGISNYLIYNTGFSLLGYKDGQRDWMVAISGFNVNQPYTNVVKESMRPVRWTLFMEKKLFQTSAFRLDLLSTVQKQQQYLEIQAGLLTKTKIGNDLFLEGGMSYRSSDALISYLGIGRSSVLMGLSYDINISALQDATGRRGGPELYLKYMITKVKPLKGKKKCCPNY